MGFIFGKKKDGKPPKEFYTDCLQSIHETATRHGVAKNGVIFIPELIPIGSKLVLSLLKDSYFQMQFGGNPSMYYYAIFSMSIETGIAIGYKWHTDFKDLNIYSDQLQMIGPAQAANALLKQFFAKPIADSQGNSVFSPIYETVLKMLEPYFKLSDPRDYIYNAMLAGYQLGVSMILETQGF